MRLLPSVPVLSLALTMALFSWSAQAEKITIAAAADLKFAMDEIVTAFKKTHPTDEITVIYGSAGKFFTQIQQGAPYDLYFSADIAFPHELENKGLAGSTITPYAIGRIVLWSTDLDASQMTLQSLTDPAITRIAIANPQHAPYGRRAEEALRASGLWERLQPKLVLGEDMIQVSQFVQSGNAQVGIISLSFALNPELARKGGYWLIPDTLHEPLEQAFIITKRAEHNALARAFADYMQTPDARATMTAYGFVLPGETAASSH
ncbi:molybdate ABC transporter substrate-binding protein [Thermochromatium tepidum]|uniref:Molybdate ABC transporter substrate-binding protein n=1 Tax=Thermochromatium tepidum ATCC 43061 TaxID=316276 RepID=A0A6I6DZY6_THETI|nr:molybdate ABC transporter substrate-binding protein [Thermochromatium tepidum]QGU32255.1 molybdate ABC transporter substrate-binding protein [Thermochromatium tepidum ATCC 43061]